MVPPLACINVGQMAKEFIRTGLKQNGQLIEGIGGVTRMRQKT
jgi:hypothetical protein